MRQVCVFNIMSPLFLTQQSAGCCLPAMSSTTVWINSFYHSDQFVLAQFLIIEHLGTHFNGFCSNSALNSNYLDSTSKTQKSVKYKLMYYSFRAFCTLRTSHENGCGCLQIVSAASELLKVCRKILERSLNWLRVGHKAQ